MGLVTDLVRTVKTSFGIGKATLDASGLTVARTHTLPDKSGTVAMTSDISGAGTSLGLVLAARMGAFLA